MPGTIKVNVKWSGKKYDAIELDLTQPGVVFKTQLQSLTGVPPDRQKIMVKGGMLKDDADMAALQLKEGQTLMMMGTAGSIKPTTPPPVTQFLEDMTEKELAKTLEIPAGLENLGNTCYMNSTLQCLRSMPELTAVLRRTQADASLSKDPRSNLTGTLANLYKELAGATSGVPPLLFLHMLRDVFPQFSEQDAHGYMQQDAEECWTQMLQVLKEKVPGLSVNGETDKSASFVDQFMEGRLRAELKCDESAEEPVQTSYDSFLSLKVNIGSGVSTYMMADMKAGLTEAIEKTSETLGRTARYTKTSQLDRLPKYLAVSFVRFQWKADKKLKAKILKRVQFPKVLDMTELCTPELRAKLAPAKALLQKRDEAAAEARKQKKARTETADGTDLISQFKAQARLLRELGVDDDVIRDVGCNPSGIYDLVAVLTHKGLGANSGHYMAWVKNRSSPKPDASSATRSAARAEDADTGSWWMFNDDQVSPVTEEEITKLEGGGDWHTAYICLYAAKDL
ncbi:hypothetical protein CXG81DRAFT_13055 [Caulochytrium protostelioides]|uniref:Ubiquitin carboxyl-terminal hydrolase n=1 Tax=Caulochytrium protostelioides TaxID=1555241 RepID=A0A4P9WZR6_9FUNG|nr:cysteine proteinase [Caulochytrium protostelioides]RKP00585.1 hypothetical protein CXG81DRAFT_13055 [Caulochytrium protostelioides]|eukprot:RKP00585.1 hypothetical protein CXG81DRAFT_13055 [Caulochytrium protostelioides]